MKHITIVIPTRGRLQRLLRTLDSIPPEPWITIKVVCDADEETFLALVKKGLPHVEPRLVPTHSGSVACRNSVIPDTDDGLFWATDDVVFEPGAFKTYLDLFNKKFPDDDGVVGIRQLTPHHPTGVGLMGKVFLNRYPKREPFFPEYWHFACQEIGRLANKVGKFYFCEEPPVTHISPNQNQSLIDVTHQDARRYKKSDMKLNHRRKREGLVWGAK